MDRASKMAWPGAAKHFANAPKVDRENIAVIDITAIDRADNRFINKVSTLP